ncbi:right-handed parallel beta-helix repeat-containing protein [uncultured Pseudodesulfovibrio sp.]|uniref:right-handed parallel beta-helix repeat-containing protein n=1 Tax=uncultured Pseudodesulfovibrio sp. TaxID=2035858 RepID=UPI0029C885B0|nr:right-handed parallel beta-helix repeat-containing protein [uncultured Pseudodesulfovibrio sp.]
MHRLLIALFLICLTAFPATAEQTVIGTGNPGQDIANVQAAVDAGGTVLLKGRFNFGPEGRIKITKDIRIKGEFDSVDEPKTKISGGWWTFYSPLPVKGAQPSRNGPIIAIRSIHFDGAKGTPLHFPHVGGLDLRGCTVTDVIPQETGIRWSDGDTLPFMAGVVVGNRLDFRKKPIKRAATGTIRIENNRFFMETGKPERTAGYGIMVDWTWDAEITIENNTIHRASRNGIEALDNSLGGKNRGSISIENNRITTADSGIPYPHKYGPNGIVAGWYIDTTGGVDFSRNNRIALTGNRIEGRGEASTGMLLYANDIIATCNDIIMGGGSQARGIVQTGSRGFFANNRVRGESRYAIYCYPFEALRGSSNTFAWTELNDFTAIKDQILLGGNVNVIIGNTPSLLDKGKGNRVVETAPCALPEIDPEGENWEPVDNE